LFAHGRFNDARILYRKIIWLDKHNEYAWDWLVYTYANEGRIDEALRAGDKALTINPDSISLYITLGDVYLRNGDYTKACTYFTFIRTHKEKAMVCEYLNAMSAYKTGMRKLAVTCEKMGEIENASQVLTELLETYPHDSDARKRLRGLSQ